MWIKNVRLEKNYIEEDGIIYKTETKIVNIEVENGKIIKIQRSITVFVIFIPLDIELFSFMQIDDNLKAKINPAINKITDTINPA